jgi:hypothetical protein
MDAQQRIVDRLSMLINEGYGVILASGNDRETQGVSPRVEGTYVQWHLGSLSFFATVFNPGNIYLEAFGRIPNECPHEHFLVSQVEKGLGILRAAQNEINFGALPGIEALFSAEIFEDFLSMAEHLFDQKYFAVVPSLVGAVLEDGLRKIAKRKDLIVKQEDNIAGLNTRLFDAKAYSLLVRKKIEVWNNIRNNADHGKFDVNSPQDIGQMLEGVRGFLAEHLK